VLTCHSVVMQTAVGSYKGWTLSLLVLAYCKVGVCILQGWCVQTARWAYAYCKVGVGILQGGHVQQWEVQLTNAVVHVLIVQQTGKRLD